MFPNAVPHGIVDGLRDEVLLCRVAMFGEAYKKKNQRLYIPSSSISLLDFVIGNICHIDFWK